MAEGVEKKRRRIIRRPRVQHPDGVDYESMNRTELVQLAQFNEIPGANMGTPREILIWALKEMQPIGENPIDKKRDKLKWFLNRYWSVAGPQMPFQRCPNCELSTDAQVALCYVPNKNKEHLK